MMGEKKDYLSFSYTYICFECSNLLRAQNYPGLLINPNDQIHFFSIIQNG